VKKNHSSFFWLRFASFELIQGSFHSPSLPLANFFIFTDEARNGKMNPESFIQEGVFE
jgi:hypothetical protein